MTERASHELPARVLVARVARIYMAPRWKGWSVAIVAAVAVAALSALLAYIIRPATNDLLVLHKGPLWRLPAIIVALALGRTIGQVLQATLINRIGNGVVADIQLQLFGKLVRADLAHLRTQHSGAYVSSVLYDAGLTREAATTGVVNYVQNVLTVVGMIGLMIYNDWILSLFLIVAAPLASLIMRRFSKQSTKAAKGAMAETSALSTAIMESLDGIRVVKIENREAYEEARVGEVVRRREKHLVRGSNARARAAPATELVMMVVTALVFAYAGWRAQHGGMSPGAFLSFVVALGTASQSLRQVANLQTTFAEGLTAARRLFAALDVEPEIRDREGAAALPRAEGRIRFEGVGFSYGGEGPSALSDIDFEAAPGETVALVGPSGGGKTTILNLIPRFYDVSAGRVKVDGHDVRDVTLASLRAQIALVTQEPFLFDDTIGANIAYARPEASRAEVEAAAQAAAAHDFIAALPGGYDTAVGEAGARRRRRSRPRRRRRREGSSPPFRMGFGPVSGRAGSASPAASASVSPSPARCCAIRACCCSTRRPVRSTPKARRWCRRHSADFAPAARRSWWRTGYQRFATPTWWSRWRPAARWKPAPMRR
ncbi:MAG: ABC transporter ATP-binding protein [Alphaproteobacteria bacterium]|nr:ABC transporter ATP-binding protein [Alphaproteobacteria bacterium]